MKKVNVVIGTFLPFHAGHMDLIRFASEYDSNTEVHVIISSRRHEPIDGYSRYYAIQDTFSDDKMIIVHHHEDDKAPQAPDSNDDPSFWNYWYKAIHLKIGSGVEVDTVFASEHYGKKLAAVLGADFVPYDVDRETINMSGTQLRENITDPVHWTYLPRSMRSQLSTKVVLIGPESIGKTTISKALAETNDWEFVPEWARGYLETVGSELSYSKMHTIFKGQLAMEKVAKRNSDRPVLVHDTDLIATWAYHHISGILPISNEFQMTMKGHYGSHYKMGELYLLLSDDLHFTPDPLRYGGDKRESTNDYWETLLLHFGVKYVKIPKGSIEETELLCRHEINKHLDEKFKDLRNFKRES